MANVRSIIDVDVNSDSFKEFQKRFEAYQAALKGMPADWAKTGAAAADAAKAGAKGSQEMAAAMVSMTAALSAAVRQQGDLGRGIGTTDRAFKGVARTTGEILKNVTDTTFQLIKWAAFGGVLGVAAGGFGAGALASAGADIRRTSGQYGVSPGQLRAARAIYGPQLDADATLQNITGAQADLSKRWSLSALGISGDQMNRSAGDLLPQVLQGAVDAYRRTGGILQGYNAQGAGNLVDFNTARELSRLPAGELAREAGQYGTESRRLDIPDATLEKMKALNQAFDVAKDRIETVLIGGLSKLAGPLEHLSDSIVKALETFMSNPNLGKSIESFGQGIEHVATYLSSAAFKQDINDFAGLIHKVAHPGETLKNKFDNELSFGSAGSNLLEAAKRGLGINAATQFVREQVMSASERQYGLPAGILDKVWAAESSRGANATSHGTGDSMIFGDFQTMVRTGKGYGITPQSGWGQQEEGTARLLADLLRDYKGDTRKALAAYNFGEGKLNKVIAAHPADWANYVPRETQGYLARTATAGASTGVTVTVNNQVGADITPIMTQLVH